jgi:acetylornithine deacetylase/succinyl-diaminopimelate desuccinylase-like protein
MKTGLSSELEQLKKLYEENKAEALRDFFTFLKFPSISSEPAFKEPLLECAKWLEHYIKSIGFEVEIWPTSGHPTLFASYTKAGPNQPTLLIYNHYDVQPVDPLNLWKTPPFEPTEIKGEIYARGAQDNKGQCFYVLFALKKLIERDGRLPINVKLCIEGEEECGSSGLAHIMQQKKEQLKADYTAIVDLGIPNPATPAITLGVRGLITMDVEVSSSHTDLHSGSHGGIAFNPIHALIKLLAMVRDETGRITIPGFYDNIVSWTNEERKHVSLNFDALDYEKTFGNKPTGGETNLSPLERNWMRPTFEVNGINGGYTREGFKTVIPAKAFAKISCRIVPNQDPLKIGNLVANFLEGHAPEGTKVSVQLHEGSGKALHVPLKSEAVKAFAKAYEEIFGVRSEYIYSGASIPITAELAEVSGSEVVMVGLGLPSDCIHAPNEHFGIDRLEKGFLSIARALQLLRKN